MTDYEPGDHVMTTAYVRAKMVCQGTYQCDNKMWGRLAGIVAIPLLRWPAPLTPDPDTLPPLEAIRARPTRSLSGHAWDAWCHIPQVHALLTHCRVPAQVHAGLIAVPVDDPLLHLIRQVYAAAQHSDGPASHVERAQWLLDWAKRAQATFGAQARIGFS